MLSFAQPYSSLAVAAETKLAPAAQSSPQLIGNQETVSLAATLFKTIGALALVIGIMLVLVYLVRKFGLGGQPLKQGSLINVVDSRLLAPKKQVTVIEVAGEYMLLGISEQQINLISKLEESEALKQAINSGSVPSGFSDILKKTIQGKKDEAQKDA